MSAFYKCNCGKIVRKVNKRFHECAKVFSVEELAKQKSELMKIRQEGAKKLRTEKASQEQRNVNDTSW